MILKLLRNGLGMIVVFVSYVTLPKKVERSETEQQAVNEAVKGLKLYQLYACPFCVKTRRTIHKLNLPIEYRGVQMGSEFRTELEQQGGKIQSPCLRIEDDKGAQWMYESSDIVAYLNKHFSISA